MMSAGKTNRWRRFWAWITGNGTQAPAVRSDPPFKEFIYLDEISVVSLLVSRVGELTEEFQEGWSHESSTTAEDGFNAGLKDVAAVNARSSFQTKNSQSVQATRKANIQSKFGRLHHAVRTSSLLFPDRSVNDVQTKELLIEEAALSRSVNKVERGMLVEFDVVLRADPIFDKSAIVTEVAEIGEDHSDILGEAVTGVFPGEMKSFGKFLDRLMAGLVPIRCLVRNVVVVTVGGSEYLADRESADKLHLEYENLELVAVLDRSQFWKDMRRVLFSDAPVTIMARVSVDGIRPSWTPIKLLDLFRSTFPGSQDLVDALETLDFGTESTDDVDKKSAFRDALQCYSEAWQSQATVTLGPDHAADLVDCIERECANFGTAASRRDAFRQVRSILIQGGTELLATQDAELRQISLRQSGHDPFGNVVRQDGEVSNGSTNADTTDPVPSKLLEVEVVAMYW